jgi:ubiquinone/menaquinone biosynthesis C-methylase UbiE
VRADILVRPETKAIQKGMRSVPPIISAERTSAVADAERPIRERQMAAYREALKHIEGRQVLEIGCGEGIGASVLAEAASAIIAVDYSEDALQLAREEYGSDTIEFRRMRVPPIDCPDSSIDVVVCFQMIEHLERPDLLVEEIARVVRDGGLALIATVNKEETLSDNPYHLHEFTADELKELLERHFDSIDMDGVYGDEQFMKYWINNRRWVNRFMRLDMFNLSSLMPPGIRKWLFDAVSTFMRTRLKSGSPDLCEGITFENFLFKRNEYKGAIDFFAVCHKGPK